MLSDFKKHIETNLDFLKKARILIACSGGLDSIVLTHLLKTLRLDIALAHCNFSLRKDESDADETFVFDLADKYSVPVFIETFDTKKYAKDTKQSTQMAARELRYAWFAELRKTLGYDYVVTAHHADDDLETFLINLSRGSGIRGLTGIPETNEHIVRPLLPFSREEILNYAKANQLYWREDSSNAKTEYLRNKLRHDIIPNFKEAAPKVLQNLLKTQRHLTESQLLVEDYMALVYNLAITENFDGYTLHLQKLKELPNTDALLYELLHPFGFTDFIAISDLLEAQSGKQVFSSTHRLTKDRNVLLLTEATSNSTKKEIIIPEETTEILEPIHLIFKEVKKIRAIDVHTIFVDKELLSYPITLRKWKEGDIFQPFGMRGKKKLSKFFKDEKVSLIAKEKMYVLCNGYDIIWVVGLRADDRFKVTSATKQILKITHSD